VKESSDWLDGYEGIWHSIARPNPRLLVMTAEAVIHDNGQQTRSASWKFYMRQRQKFSIITIGLMLVVDGSLRGHDEKQTGFAR
jgi:hypothetical protein